MGYEQTADRTEGKVGREEIRTEQRENKRKERTETEKTRKQRENRSDYNAPDDLTILVPLEFLLLEQEHGVGLLGLLEEPSPALVLREDRRNENES